MSELEVGQTVELADGRIAIVRFVGQPHFATGDWVGVELEDDSGKNDGSVQGERYFDCRMGRGMFLRPAVVTVIAQAAPLPLIDSMSTRRVGRPSSTIVPAPGKRLSSVPDSGVGKRMSLNAASPSLATRMSKPNSRPSSILRSPTKSPTKQLASAATSGTSSPRTGTPSNGRVPSVSTSKARPSTSGNRSSMGPPSIPASRSSRQSLGGTTGSSARLNSGPARPVSVRQSFAPRPGVRVGSGKLNSIASHLNRGQGSEASGNDTADEECSASPVPSDLTDNISSKHLSPLLPRALAVDRVNAPSPNSARSTASPVAQRSISGSNATAREVEDLKTKIRLMEKKRMEDRDRMKVLEKVQADRDKFESIIQKLQAKYQPQQQEITELRKQLKESATRFEEIESMQAEHDVVVEMATLDREMAEETAEVLKTELEALKMKLEELELEVEVLREENAELGGEMSPEEKASQGWLQMERNNERLREALLRLRDMTQQQEAELRDQIKSLEEDVRDLGGVKDHFEAIKEKLAQSESSIEDLRQQLDNALGAEDMIEELTEKNMSMNEQIEELRATIEDLESLKELNDELEINHVETEKEMQEDIDFKETIISEQARRAAQQDETLEDMEYTLSKFRELVANLQTDLEDMKASHAVTETESEQLTNHSRAMMDLNMKLQVSAAKTQVKAIDLELRRLDAQEASDHLAIIQLFLPEAYNTDRDSVLALLRFKRVGFKANMLHGFVKDRASSQSLRGHEDDIFAACDVLDKLAWVDAMCTRFVNAISHCSIEQFAKYEGAMYELEPVERALNGWVDGLRRDEFKEKQCAGELQRTIALMSHLAEVHIPESLSSFADDVHMRTLIMQSHLENAATALTATKAMVQNIVASKADEDDLAQHFAKKADTVVSHIRSTKVVVGKAVRSLKDLKTRSLSVTPDTIQIFEQCETGTQELAIFSRRIGEDLFDLLHEEGRPASVSYVEVQTTLHRTAASLFQTSESDLFSTFTHKTWILTSSVTDLAALTSDLSMTLEFERAPNPWLLRSQALKATRVVSVDAADEMRRLKDESHERARLIALRDQTLEEASVKIETLERRMRDAVKKNEQISELEQKIEEAKKHSNELGETVETQNRELTAMEADRDKWKKVASNAKAIGDIAPGSKAGQERAIATVREMEILRSEISALQAAVRYLRNDNRRLHFVVPQNLEWLDEPLIKLKSKEELRRELVLVEGQDVLNELLNLTTEARLYNLATSPANRLAWRPARSTPQWHVARQKEDYENWRSWQDAVIRKANTVVTKYPSIGTGPVAAGKRKKRAVAAKLEIRLANTQPNHAGLGQKGLANGHEVKIVEPREWDRFRREYLNVA